MRKLLFFILSSVVVFGITLFFRLGGNKPVQIEIRTLPELHLLYKEHLGAYHTIVSSINEVENWAASHNIPCAKTFGEFLDDPKTTEERHLRSQVGCVLESAVTSETSTAPFLTKSHPAQRYLWARFDGAPSIGPMKVYPKIQEELKKQSLEVNGSPLEIYTIKSGNEIQTEYLFPLK